MQCEKKVNGSSKCVRDGFGFNESEVGTSVLNNSSVLNETSAPIQFRPDKPYRLALYVRPNEQRIIQRANASVIIKNIMEKQRRFRKLLNNNTNYSPGGKNENAKGKRRERKLNSVSLFEDKSKPEPVPKSSKKLGDTPKRKKNVSISETTPTRRNILTQSNAKSFPSLRQATIKRLYEKRVKEKEVENIPDPEPPSDQIMKELEEKKLSKAKVRNPDRGEEEDFENWASNVNSDFNDVDQFELSVSYD